MGDSSFLFCFLWLCLFIAIVDNDMIDGHFCIFA